MVMSVLPERISSKPHYVFYPGRTMRRVLRGVRSDAEESRAVAALPWGLPLEVYRSDAIGWNVLTCGVFDPCVTETLYRLIDPGDVVIDAGANIGYMTSVAAARSASSGRVVAYEPHPVVFELLASNVARWNAHPCVARVEPEQAALSDLPGAGELEVGPMFHANMGLAKLRVRGGGQAPSESLAVELKRLDTEFDGPIGLLKVDVEGHEPAVLRGARRLLGDHRIRDVIFEDHERYPSEATAIVEEAGYRVFRLANDLFGLRLQSPEQRATVRDFPGPSYLASCDPERALRRLRPRGWRVAGIGPPFRGSRIRVTH
jgi:FkbM family methyltransferase